MPQQTKASRIISGRLLKRVCLTELYLAANFLIILLR